MDGKKKNIIELTRAAAVTDYKSLNKKRLTLVVDSVRSMLNIGSLFRTADAFLLEKIVLCGISGTPPHPEISKSALGAENVVEWSYSEDALKKCEELKREGYEICVLEQVHGSIKLDNFLASAEGRYALVLGNEVEGVNQKIVDIADYVLEIPMGGMKHSLNVSVCAGIAIWHIYRQLK